jgi:O-antigen ligase
MSGDRQLQQFSFIFTAIAIFGGPWIFGAWAFWWFWPFAACIFLGFAFFCLRLCYGRHELLRESPADARLMWTLIAGCVPFLLYALIRFLQTEVYMSAERSFLLILLPFLIGVQIVYGFSGRQVRALHLGLLLNLAVQGVYGLVNHALNGSRVVLWRDGFIQYWRDDRASGSYFCPDHFAGAMEFAMALGLGVAFARSTRTVPRLAALALCAVAVWCVIWSKSRGGGITIAGMILFAIMIGLVQWPRILRWSMRVVLLVALVGGVAAFLKSEHPYVERFKRYPYTELEHSHRVNMIMSAVRAWKQKPVFGVGAGMHEHYWLRTGPSPDGDRAAGRWPTRPNFHLFSYKVHSDWVQLLEEYGIVGFVLFGVAASGVLGLLGLGYFREAPSTGPPSRRFQWVLGALFAICAMTIHSVGDFNLQIPANGWMFGAILGIGVAGIVRRGTDLERRIDSEDPA